MPSQDYFYICNVLACNVWRVHKCPPPQVTATLILFTARCSPAMPNRDLDRLHVSLERLEQVERLRFGLSRFIHTRSSFAVLGAPTSAPSSRSLLRIMASYRSRIETEAPDVWWRLERWYRQHLREKFSQAEARHWDAALRLPE